MFTLYVNHPRATRTGCRTKRGGWVASRMRRRWPAVCSDRRGRRKSFLCQRHQRWNQFNRRRQRTEPTKTPAKGH